MSNTYVVSRGALLKKHVKGASQVIILPALDISVATLVEECQTDRRCNHAELTRMRQSGNNCKLLLSLAQRNCTSKKNLTFSLYYVMHSAVSV